jgi:hypothetical protein
MKAKFVLAIIILLLLPTVSSAAFTFNFGSSIGGLGQSIYTVLNNDYTVYAASFILFFILLYAIFAAALARVKVFQGEGAISRNGKMVAVALSLLSSMGVFVYMRGIHTAIERVNGTLGWFGAVALAGLVFAITYFNIKTNEEGTVARGAAFFATALALLLYGMFTDSKGAADLGALILLITAIWAAISAFRRPRGPSDREQEREIERQRERDHDRDEEDNRERERASRRGIQVPQQVRDFQGRMNP